MFLQNINKEENNANKQDDNKWSMKLIQKINFLITLNINDTIINW